MQSPIWRMLLLSLSLASFVFLVNAIVPSWVNGFPAHLNTDITRLWHNDNPILETRLANPEFARRPVVLSVHRQLNRFLPDQAAFNIIQFVLLIAFFFSLRYLLDSKPVAKLVAYSFPICFAYVGSIHTYDDILQFTLCIAAIAMMMRRKYLTGWWILLLGCIVRETTLLFVPVFTYFHYASSYTRKWTALVSLALLGLFLFFVWYTGSANSLHFNLTTRLTGWTKNFSDFRHTSESLVLPVLVLGWPLIVYLRNRKEISQQHPYLCRMVIPFIILNTLIVWAMAIAREARLYFLPVLLILPLIIPYLRIEVKRMWETMIGNTKAVVISLGIAFLIAAVFYQPTIGNTGILFKTYAFWYLTGCILMMFTHQKERPMTTATGLR